MKQHYDKKPPLDHLTQVMRFWFWFRPLVPLFLLISLAPIVQQKVSDTDYVIKTPDRKRQTQHADAILSKEAIL